MGKYLFQNGNVYFADQGGTGQTTFDAFTASSMASDRNAHVLIVEGEGVALVERVREIRRIFPKGGIRTFVPYAAALRVFLHGQSLMATDENCMVLDDLGDKFLLTAFSGHQGVWTRVIPLQDPAKIMEEMRRTHKNVMDKSGPLPRNAVFRILSNSPALIDALDPERKKNAVLFQTAFPGFEALGKTTFPMHLMPPEAVAAQKLGRSRRDLAVTCGAALLLAGAGLVFLACVRVKEQALDTRISAVNRVRGEAQDEARRISALTYQARLKTLPRIDLAATMNAFLENMPPAGSVDKIGLERGADDRWALTGSFFFPRQEIFAFRRQGVFARAELRQAFIRERPGVRVILILPDQERRAGL